MQDVIDKLKKTKKGTLSDEDEEAAADALYEAACQCFDKIKPSSPMIWALLGVHALKRAHEMSRVPQEKLMPVVQAMLQAELDEER